MKINMVSDKVSGKTHGLLRSSLEYFHLDYTVCLKENSEHYINTVHPNKSAAREDDW